MKRTIFLIVVLVSCLACGRSDRTDNQAANGDGRATSTPAATAATSSDHPAKSVTVNGKTLEPNMTDEEMLAVFDMDPAKASTRKTQGKDGYSMNYEIGPQSLNITRSVVTGVNVMAFGPIKGDWQLGKPPK